ncbi:MAG TPA: tetratricopeptide repeat protein [Candidatus Cloacimonadota bacterium]|nr:tetratricopeptide repeat protein [Candidatus Cloacimonadota bacterium]HQB40905.1 tetratricopeptide repeat protein [Candidatus Cloacimonadota bacterium]
MLFSRNRCKVCKKIIGNRYCLRTDKHICWHCCNQMRTDFKCPPTCEYYLKPIESNRAKLEINAKVDSKSEFDELNRLIADYWLNHEVEALDNNIPIMMLNNGQKDVLLSYLENAILPDDIKKYLFNRLEVPYQGQESDKHYEDYAIEFLETMLQDDFELALNHYLPFINTENTYNRQLLLDHFKSHHAIRKLKTFDLISSGISVKENEAFVTFELNSNQEYTIILNQQQDQWLVQYHAFGAINLVRTENDALRMIASALSQQDTETAYRYLTSYKQIYFFSPDIYYYEGLYHSIKGEVKFAIKAYETAIALDPFFIEAYYNLAFIMQAENQLDKAKILYNQILVIQPDNLNAMNNLGTIFLYEKNVKDAKVLFERCLTIDPNYDFAQKNIDKIKELGLE